MHSDGRSQAVANRPKADNELKSHESKERTVASIYSGSPTKTARSLSASPPDRGVSDQRCGW